MIPPEQYAFAISVLQDMSDQDPVEAICMKRFLAYLKKRRIEAIEELRAQSQTNTENPI